MSETHDDGGTAKALSATSLTATVGDAIGACSGALHVTGVSPGGGARILTDDAFYAEIGSLRSEVSMLRGIMSSRIAILEARLTAAGL